jgi:hypothetical protein
VGAPTPQQHVGRLDVTVHQAGAMRLGQAVGDLRDEVDGLPLRQQAVAPYRCPEIAVGHQLAGEEQPPVDLAVGEDLHDMGRVQRRLGPGLADEPGAEVRVVGELGEYQLERDVAAQRRVDGLVHRAHAAAPEVPHDPERTERRGRVGLAHAAVLPGGSVTGERSSTAPASRR